MREGGDGLLTAAHGRWWWHTVTYPVGAI